MDRKPRKTVLLQSSRNWKAMGDVKKLKVEEGRGDWQFRPEVFPARRGKDRVETRMGCWSKPISRHWLMNSKNSQSRKIFHWMGKHRYTISQRLGWEHGRRFRCTVRTRMMKDVKMYLDKTEFAVPPAKTRRYQRTGRGDLCVVGEQL